MLTIQYLIISLLFQVCDLFTLIDIPTKSNILKYNGDQSSTSFHSTNPYYTINNLSSSSILEYMRTLYEQEKQNDFKSDYNLIRALAPRIGKECFMSFLLFSSYVCHIRLKLKQKKEMLSAFRHRFEYDHKSIYTLHEINQTTRHVSFHD